MEPPRPVGPQDRLAAAARRSKTAPDGQKTSLRCPRLRVQPPTAKRRLQDVRACACSFDGALAPKLSYELLKMRVGLGWIEAQISGTKPIDFRTK